MIRNPSGAGRLVCIALGTLATLAAATVAAPRPAQAFEVLYSFCSAANCSDGRGPVSGLVADASGNLYGTTQFGGANNAGTVFKLLPSGRQKVLHSFCAVALCDDGKYPLGGVILDADGNLYGTTSFGGDNDAGVVFELTKRGAFKVLYAFCPMDCTDGQGPAAGLVMDGEGNLYGTTAFGGSGSFQGGTVFKLTPQGDESVLHSFCSLANCEDGLNPMASLVFDRIGNLYGTTQMGGVNASGTVFKVVSLGGTAVLHSFCAGTCSDGAGPTSALVIDKSGNLYGTAAAGGTAGGGQNGTAFELEFGNQLNVLHAFCSLKNCADGENPAAGLVRRRSDGTLFGTTAAGGTHGGGTVFTISPRGRESVLHDFCAAPQCRDGQGPRAQLLTFGGRLFGTTDTGGAHGGGAVFKVGE